MTRDEIVEIAWDVGLFMRSHKFQDEPTKLERFAERIAAAEREKVAAWMHFNDYITGHGDTIEDLLEEIEAQVAERERWKCAEVAEAYEPRCDVCPRGVAAAIRARGET